MNLLAPSPGSTGHVSRTWITRLLLGIMLVLCAQTASAYTITLHSSEFHTHVFRTLDRKIDSGSPGTLLGAGLGSSVNDGLTRSTVSYNHSNDAFTYFFDKALPWDVGASGEATFSVDEDVFFNISGNITLRGITEPAATSVSAFLRDETTRTVIYDHRHSASDPNINTSIVLGKTVSGGDDLVLGSPTGMLITGRTYRFIGASRVTNPAAGTVIGQIKIAFTPVPEPSTALLMALGLIGLGARRRQVGSRRLPCTL